MRLAKGASSASGRSGPWPGKRVTGVGMGGLGGCGLGGENWGVKRQAATPSQWLPALSRADGGSDRSSVRRGRKVKVLGILFGDLHHREDGPCWQLVALEARLGGELDRFVDELRRERHIGLYHRVAAVHQRLDHALGTTTAEHQFDVLALVLVDGLH